MEEISGLSEPQISGLSEPGRGLTPLAGSRRSGV